LTIFTVAILFARRPDQFLHPYIWVEDGQYILREYLEQGAGTLLNPLAGYYMLATKLISYIAFKVSIIGAPTIELVLITALTIGVTVAIATAPTHLRWPYACAIATLLIPTDAENFAVSLYAFWWAGILLFLALLWNPDRGMGWLRAVFILFGGLSSALAISLCPLFILRAVIERRRSEYIAAALCALTAIVQLYGLHIQHIVLAGGMFSLERVPLIAQKFVGDFALTTQNPALGSVLAVGLLSTAAIFHKRLNLYFVLLLAIFGAVSVSLAGRIELPNFPLIDKLTVAPRYFFYPFILLGWGMIWLAAVGPFTVRIFIAAIFALSLYGVGNGLSRRHDPVSWRQHIRACAAIDGQYMLPMHYIGHANQMWLAPFTGAECRKLLASSLFTR